MSNATTHIETEKQLVPALRFKEFEGYWEQETHGTVAHLQRGFDLPKRDRVEGDFPIISSGGITGYHNEKKAAAPGIVTGRYGSIGEVFFIDKDFWPLNTSLWVKEFYGNNVRFIFFLLSRFDYKKFSDKTGVPGINRNDIHPVKVWIPFLPEQQKIASFLSAVDEKIQQLTKKKALLEQYKKGVMQQLFRSAGSGQASGQLRFKDENGNSYPDWEVHEIGEFVKDRKVTATSDAPLYSLTIERGVVPKSKRYERSFLVKGEEGAYKLMLPYDFAFNPMNLRFGALAMYKGVDNVAVSKYYDIFYCNDKCDQDYLEYYLTSYKMIQFYNKMSTGTLEEKKRVHYLDFIHFKKLFPSLPEQQKIATYLSRIDTKIEAINNQITQTQTFKKGLLQQMFV
jgi:type I restriction enzyme S subunit